MAAGKRPVPSRTRKLSPPAPMVLPGRSGGRVGRGRTKCSHQAPEPFTVRGLTRSGVPRSTVRSPVASARAAELRPAPRRPGRGDLQPEQRLPADGGAGNGFRSDRSTRYDSFRDPLRGLWRSLVAHLVRIEGVRKSNLLRSTATRQSPGPITDRGLLTLGLAGRSGTGARDRQLTQTPRLSRLRLSAFAARRKSWGRRSVAGSGTWPGHGRTARSGARLRLAAVAEDVPRCSATRCRSRRRSAARAACRRR